MVLKQSEHLEEGHTSSFTVAVGMVKHLHYVNEGALRWGLFFSLHFDFSVVQTVIVEIILVRINSSFCSNNVLGVSQHQGGGLGDEDLRPGKGFLVLPDGPVEHLLDIFLC